MKQQQLRRTGLLNKDSLGVARIYQLQQLASLAATKNWTTTRFGLFCVYLRLVLLSNEINVNCFGVQREGGRKDIVLKSSWC